LLSDFENRVTIAVSHSSLVTGLNCLMSFKAVKKRWTGALLSAKCCCFCAKTIVKMSHSFTQFRTSTYEEEERKTFWPSGEFVVWYFCNAFSNQWACGSSWKRSKV